MTDKVKVHAELFELPDYYDGGYLPIESKMGLITGKVVDLHGLIAVYVGVPKGHPFYELEESLISDAWQAMEDRLFHHSAYSSGVGVDYASHSIMGVAYPERWWISFVPGAEKWAGPSVAIQALDAILGSPILTDTTGLKIVVDKAVQEAAHR